MLISVVLICSSSAQDGNSSSSLFFPPLFSTLSALHSSSTQTPSAGRLNVNKTSSALQNIYTVPPTPRLSVSSSSYFQCCWLRHTELFSLQSNPQTLQRVWKQSHTRSFEGKKSSEHTTPHFKSGKRVCPSSASSVSPESFSSSSRAARSAARTTTNGYHLSIVHYAGVSQAEMSSTEKINGCTAR